ncbi:MAG: WG repeat-containing protein [Crocinitomicaceae bacterium]|nr:WG repeat-containing protein [Crocinitomicaceae bacterium]
MKQFLFFLVAFSSIYSHSQFFKKTTSGYEMYSDSSMTKRIGTDVYENCWSKKVFAKDSSFLFYEGRKNQRGYYAVKKNGKWGGIDATGKEVKAFTFDAPFEQRKSGHYLVFDNLKDTLDQLKYKIGSTISRYDSTMNLDTSFYIMDDYKGTYLVSYNKIKFGLINADFKLLLPMKYESVTYKMLNFRFNPSGFLPLENELDKCGVVNYTGKIVIPFNYEWMNDYVWNDNFIFVQNGKKKGFVNTSNVIVVPLKYETCPMFLGPKNLVADENYTWFVNEKFEAISQKYQALEREGNVYFFKQNGKWGVADVELNVIVPNLYTSIEYGPRLKSNPDFKCYYAVKNGKYGLISLTNEIIVPFEYECLCGLSYYAPDAYYIEFKKAGSLYRFDYTGKLVEKVVGEGKACLCEMVPGQ